MHQLLCLLESHFRTIKRAFHPSAFTQRLRCDSSQPLQYFFDVLAFCSHFLNSSGITICASLCHLLHYMLNTSLSDLSMSYSLLCTQPPSITIFRNTSRCLSVHSSLTSGSWPRLLQKGWLVCLSSSSVSSSFEQFGVDGKSLGFTCIQ